MRPNISQIDATKITDKARELIALYNSPSEDIEGDESVCELERIHDQLAEGAVEEDYAQTGGNVMVSYTSHRVGLHRLLVSAGDDSIFVYLMPGWMTLSGAQDAVLELSGDDDAFMLMWSDYDHREPVLGWAGKALAYDALVSK